jgi:hypothetical protein
MVAFIRRTLQDAVSEALEATEGQPAEVQAAAVAAAIPPPSPEAAIGLWRTLVTGLVIVLVLSLIGIMWAVLDGNANTSPDVIVTIFTAALTGLIGLFVRSPMQS